MEDRTSFETAVEPLLRPLHAHCYRFVGGLGQADDLVQETLLRAWRNRTEIRDPQAMQAWLFRIATNACLDELRRARPRLSPWTDDAEPGRDWVEPYPDVLVDGLADPAGRYSIRESVNLAFVSALQLLSPRQRASLILRDVLDWRAAEVAALLEVSTASVESALARARAVIEETPAAEPVPEELDEDAQAFLERYIAAWEAADVDAIADLLRDDVRYGMPPLPLCVRGRDAVRGALAGTAFVHGARYRMVPTRAGGRIALAGYAATGDRWQAQVLQLVELDGALVADVVAYLDPGLVARAGLPETVALPSAHAGP
jgi:RNA polymerase sigma-70 factor (ECF subfamily)